ncbi:MAG: sigma54 specific transcriptional regulator, Fis family, partial [Bacteroidetes bacterium]|nr:sigma54 specific transcriptional regulator, Fis family [Bacteroidota bacterium]
MTSIQDPSSRFLTIFAELSAKFINMSLDNVDKEIVVAQERICKEMDVDRCTLWQFSDVHNSLVATHMSSRIGAEIKGRLVASELFPWVLEKINRRETVCIPSVDDLPPEASIDLASFHKYQLKSNITVPLCVENTVIGCMSFGDLRRTRQWTAHDVGKVQLIAQVIANVLDRKNKERALHESEAKVAMASLSAGIGFWGVESGTGNLWATEKARELMGFGHHARLTPEDFYSSIHAGDRERVRAYLERERRSGVATLVDFRAIHPDGSEHWVSVRGSRLPDGSSPQMDLTGIIVDISERKKAEIDL